MSATATTNGVGATTNGVGASVGASLDKVIGEIRTKATRPHPKLAAAWTKAHPFVRASLFGAAFAGGALLLANLLGPPTVGRLGRRGGNAFAEGVNEVNQRIASFRGRGRGA